MVARRPTTKKNPGRFIRGRGLKSLGRHMPHYGALATLRDAVSDRDGAAKAREMLTAIKATTKTKSLAMCRSDTTPPYVASFVPDRISRICARYSGHQSAFVRNGTAHREKGRFTEALMHAPLEGAHHYHQMPG
jgi:hypothetical protein